MSQNSQYQKICQNHPTNQLLLTCLEQKCNPRQLLCKMCVDNFHSDHQNEIFNHTQFNEQVKELYDKSKDLINSYQAVEATSIMGMNHQQLEQYIQEMQQKEKEEIFFINGLKDSYTKVQQTVKRFLKQFQNWKQVKDEQQHMQQKIEKLFTDGDKLRLQGKYNESIQMMDQLLLIDPKHKYALGIKGDCLRLLGQYEESIQCIDKAHEITPLLKEALYIKGDSLRMVGKYQESIVWIDKLLIIDSKYKLALYSKGESLRMLKKYKEAQECLLLAISLPQPYNHVLALGSIGACLIDLDQIEEAQKYFDQAQSMEPNNQWIKDQLIKLQEKKQK